MFKFTNKHLGDTFLIGRPFFTCFKTFQNQKKWFYFFSGINTFLTKSLPRSPEIIKIPIKCLKSLIFSGETLKNIKKYLPQNLPQTSFRGYFLTIHFHFLKIWKSFLKNLKINYFLSRWSVYNYCQTIFKKVISFFLKIKVKNQKINLFAN